MVFSSVTFLFYFFPLFFTVYYIAGKRMRNLVLLIASLIFYLWGAGDIVFLLMFSIFCNWLFGLAVSRANQYGFVGLKKISIALCLIVNLSILVFFKYANFLLEQVNFISGFFFAQNSQFILLKVILPIGISFFTFQAISYVLDVSKKRVKALINPIDFGMYLCMFPQLIAGPIVRFRQIAHQIKHRPVSLEDVFGGMLRFVHGLAKKVIIADSIALIADYAFASSTTLTTGVAWIGVFAFIMQIYFDFSGYSDMALGMGRMLGFSFPENFRRPYSAISMTDFWQRWHISLSTWFRDYVYIPMSLGKRPQARIYFNLTVLFLLIGIWHGAAWTFVFFGLYHAAWICLEKKTGQRFGEQIRYRGFWQIATLFIVLLGGVLFRSESIHQAVSYFKILFSFGLSFECATWGADVHMQHFLALFISALSLFLPKYFITGIYIQNSETRLANIVRLGMATVILPLTIILIVSRNFKSFIYFQF